MAIAFITVRNADNKVIQSGRGSGVIPDNTLQRTHIDATIAVPDLITQWETMKHQLALDARSDLVTWNPVTQQLEMPPDTRPIFRFQSDKLIVDADGVDFATLTVTRLNAQGGTQTGFNATRILRHDESGRKFRLIFVSGVATKALRGRQSGDVRFHSTPAYKIETPLEIEFVE